MIQYLRLSILPSFLITLSLFCSTQVRAALKGGPESVSIGRYQGVTGTRGMVVSDDRQASEWGAEILHQGGNAIDAAVATAFALAVTRPHYASLGGGGFIVYCPHAASPTSPKPECQTLDYRETAPSHATETMYVKNGKANPKLAETGALASGVPGTPAGLLYALEKFGKLSRKVILKRPIELARMGFVFSPYAEKAAIARWPVFNSAAKEIFGCPSLQSQSLTQACITGTTLKQKDLAHVLERISSQGKDGFYRGEIAKKIVEGIQKAGGILTLEDLKAYHPVLRQPLISSFQDPTQKLEIITMGPPSSGGALIIQLLHYAEKANQSGEFKNGFGSALSTHALIHAMSLAYADRANYFGDPDFVSIPLKELLSHPYLDKQWKTYHRGKAELPTAAGNLTETRAPARDPQYTTHLSVIDKEGNAVALTTTINDIYGSGFIPPGTGIVMNDEMDDFSVQAGVPNLFGLVGNQADAIAPNKRPLSSMSPTIVRDSRGQPMIVIGAAGGSRITTSVFLSLLNRLQYQMTLTDAVAAPRFHEQWKPPEVQLEKNGFSYETQEELKNLGYTLEATDSIAKVHALERTPDGRVIGVPDFRGEGAAVPEPL